MNPEQEAALQRAINGTGGDLASIALGMIVGHLGKQGLKPAAIGELMTLYAAWCERMAGTPETARFSAALDQTISRAKDTVRETLGPAVHACCPGCGKEVRLHREHEWDRRDAGVCEYFREDFA